jgi:hypothetical protein
VQIFSKEGNAPLPWEQPELAALDLAGWKVKFIMFI